MNRHLPHEALGFTPAVNMNQLLGIGVAEQAREAFASSVAGASAISMLSALGPGPNIMGNDYAKRLAMSGLDADRLGLRTSMSERFGDKWGVAGIGAELASKVGSSLSTAQSALGVLRPHALFETDSLAKHAALAGGLSNSIAGMFESHFEKHFAGIRDSIQSVFDKAMGQFNFSHLRRIVFPPNLVDLDEEFTLNDVWEFVQVHGVALMYVPRARIAARFLRAKDNKAVRTVLGQEFDNIVDDCEAVMDRLTWDGLFEHRDFVKEAIETIRSGHTMAAQALLTVVLDTLSFQLRPIKDKYRFSKAITAYYATTPKQQVELEDELTMQAALVWFPIREVHYSFQKTEFEKVPREYGRHPSVHGARKCQFSKRNCAQALLVVSSLMAHTDELACRAKVASTSVV
ncbi:MULTISPECIES: hypothetical protein [Corynebacterium]|uniref:hypothetical protein n=1 Tax=Corynebacterium TaxID=1716 RepID=UPI00114698FE|nr:MULTISPECIES: hypothetical protein [Corynebacterium]